jgi:vacuolar-type H+-ATPase subunit I/STV1
MSQILKALNKAQKEHDTAHLPAGDNHNSAESAIEHSNVRTLSKSIDLHVVFLGVLIVMVAIGIYLNYNISQNLASAQNRMVGIADSFKAQQVNFNKLNGLVVQMDAANGVQGKEFSAQLDKLSVNVAGQIKEAKESSKSQYAELSKVIEEQQKSIANLSGKYEELNHSVRNYIDVSQQYADQLSILKKRLAELKLNQGGQ